MEVGGILQVQPIRATLQVWLQKRVRLDLNYPPTPAGGIADFDEDAACRLDLKASTHFRGMGFSN